MEFLICGSQNQERVLVHGGTQLLCKAKLKSFQNLNHILVSAATLSSLKVSLQQAFKSVFFRIKSCSKNGKGITITAKPCSMFSSNEPFQCLQIC